MAVKADITIDIDKQVGELQNLTQIYNARVGDNKTPLTIAWRKNDLPLNLKGLHAYIVGKTGDGSYNSETGKIDFPVNTPVSQFEDDGSGTLDGGQSGLTTLLIPKQMWQNSGLFAGYIGLKSEDGSVFTSKDIWFKVLGNVLDAGVEINYFIGDFDKALAEAEKKLQDKTDSFDQITNKALDDLKQKYQQKVADADGAMDKTNAAIQEYLASMQNVASQIESLQTKLQTEDLITIKQYEQDQRVTNQLVKEQIRNWNIPSQVFDDANAITAKYPNGGDYGRLMVITKNDGHRWIYDDDKQWVDLGTYQSAEVSNGSITGDKLSAYSTNFNAIQLTPWTLDLDNMTLEVTSSSFLVKDNGLVFLKAGTYKITAWQKGKDHSFWIGYDPDANTVFTTLDEKFEPNQYYLGWAWCKDPKNIIINSPFKIVTPERKQFNNLNTADYLYEWNVPQSTNTFLNDGKQITVDFFKNKVKVLNGIPIYFKLQYYWIQPQELDFSDLLKKQTIGYIFGVQDGTSSNLKLIIQSDTFKKDIPNSIYLGWLDYSRFQYSILSNSFNDKNTKLFFKGKISVDFDKKVIHIPELLLSYHDGDAMESITATNLPFKNTEGIEDDTASGGHLGLIPDSSQKWRYCLVSKDIDRLMASGYYLGYYLTQQRIYDFGNYGRPSDLASQPWLNKKVTCLGDSITSGSGTDDPAKAQSYVPELTNLIGTNATNAGVSGSLITSGIPDKPASFAERVDQIRDQDVVTIMGGTNDFWFSAPLGKLGNGDTKTFYGALEYVVTELIKNNPVAKFLLMTPMKINPKGWGVDTPTYEADGTLHKNSAGLTELDYIKAIKDIGEKYSIPVLDMFKKSNYNPQLSQYVGADSFSVEGIHPNIHGARRLAQTIAHAINSL